jgi:hypothetical protein
MPPLKTSLKRGALVTAANWHVVLVQFVADALFKTLLAVPVVGGVFLVVLLVGGDPSEIVALPARAILPAMASILLAQPLALVAFLLAVSVVLAGGSLLMFFVKGGIVTVLAAAERGAGAIEHPPLRLPAFHRATQFSIERFVDGAMRLFRRFAVLGVWLAVVYGLATVASLAILFGPLPGSWAITAGTSIVLVAGITIVNLVYLLLQLVMAADDCTLGEATVRVAGLFRARFKEVAAIFGATLLLIVLSMAASILAAAALGLIAFVPFVGLAALPLQLIAWVVRGAVFQYIGLTALVAYLRVYRVWREASTGLGHDQSREVPLISRKAV